MSEKFEIAIIGAGPGGLGAATNAAQLKLSHVLVESKEIGNTVYNYQLRKHVMAEPNKLPLRAHVGFEAGTREQVLEAWNKAIKDTGVNLIKGEVSAIKKDGDTFQIQIGSNQLQARNVVLAIGTQGTPRKMGVPGEELPHVTYTLSDPDALNDLDIIVVGAGDAAIENALALIDRNRVSILNRTAEFARAKDANNAAILKAIEQKKIRCFYDAEVLRLEPEKAVIGTPEGEVEVKCNHLIARIGAVMPRKFLDSCGLQFPNNDPNAVPTVNERFESSVPGLFVIGALIGYPLIKQAINQGYEVVQHIIGKPLEPADQVLIQEVLQALPGEVNANLKSIRESLPLFKDLTTPQYRELIIDSTVHQTKSGDTIFERNDYTDTFFSVVSGSVAIQLPDGIEVEIKPGDFFGEMGLISGRRRSATVVATEPGVLLESPRRQIIKLMSSVESVKRGVDEKFMRNALQSSLFKGVRKEDLDPLVAKAKLKLFKKGDVLFKEGDLGDVLYFIRKGSVKVSRLNSQGHDVTRTYLAAGNYVGEMALLSEQENRRSATVSAAVACETIAISKADLQNVLNNTPEAASRIKQVSEQRRLENIASEQTQAQGALLDFIVKEGITDAANVLIIDSDLCVACDNCENACAATHGGYTRLDRKGGKSFASIQVPISCRHCENPLCMTDCPPDALTRLPDGEVIIRDSCIGCGNCVRNCPYGVIQMVYDSGKSSGFNWLEFLGLVSPSKSKEKKGIAKAGKCDMCEKLDGGPACVRACPTGAAMRVNPSSLLKLVSSKDAS